MDWHYQRIKAESRRAGSEKNVKDFIVLASQNDPYYIGSSTERLRSDWFLSQWKRFGLDDDSGKIHLRRFHYRLVSDPAPWPKTGEPYANTEKDWGKLLQAAKWARYRGLVPFRRFEDKRAPAFKAFGDLHGFSDFDIWVDMPNFGGLDFPAFRSWAYPSVQVCDLAVFIEKSTMLDALSPACRSYSIDLIEGQGELSITACYDYLARLSKRQERLGRALPGRIAYISDFDPAGRGMPVSVGRKLQYLIDSEFSDSDLSVTLEHLALTLGQVNLFDLPRIPIKASELRRSSFREAVGEGAVELDALEALHPGSLADIVSNWASQYFDSDAQKLQRDYVKFLGKSMRDYQDLVMRSQDVEELEESYKRASDRIRSFLDQAADQFKAAYSNFHAGNAVSVVEPSMPLFDSRRDYLEQTSIFQAHQAGEF